MHAAKALIVAASFFSLAAPLPETFTVTGPFPEQSAPQADGTWHVRLRDNWTRRDGERWINLQLHQGDRRQMGVGVRQSELQGLAGADENWSARDVRFSLRRDAGTFEFTGSFTNGLGAGLFTFTENREFVSAMRGKFGQQLADDDVMRLALHDVSREFVTAIEREGYKPDLDDLVRMRIHGVDAKYIQDMRQSGFDKVPVDDLVKTRIHGATPQYVQAMATAGYQGLSLDDLVKTRIHGATPEFVQGVKAAGYDKLD